MAEPVNARCSSATRQCPHPQRYADAPSKPCASFWLPTARLSESGRRTVRHGDLSCQHDPARLGPADEDALSSGPASRLPNRAPAPRGAAVSSIVSSRSTPGRRRRSDQIEHCRRCTWPRRSTQWRMARLSATSSVALFSCATHRDLAPVALSYRRAASSSRQAAIRPRARHPAGRRRRPPPPPGGSRPRRRTAARSRCHSSI